MINVDVSTHEQRAATRVGPNGNMQDVVHFPPLTKPSWFKRFLRWENLTVAGRVIEKGFVVSPILAGIITTAMGVLLAAVITISATVYWRLSDENRQNHDLLIRLDQRLQDKNERDKERKEELEKRLQNYDAVQIVQGREIVKLQERKR